MKISIILRVLLLSNSNSIFAIILFFTKKKSLKICQYRKNYYLCKLNKEKMVLLVQSVRTSDCGSEGREFESHMVP